MQLSRVARPRGGSCNSSNRDHAECVLPLVLRSVIVAAPPFGRVTPYAAAQLAARRSRLGRSRDRIQFFRWEASMAASSRALAYQQRAFCMSPLIPKSCPRSPSCGSYVAPSANAAGDHPISTAR